MAYSANIISPLPSQPPSPHHHYTPLLTLQLLALPSHYFPNSTLPKSCVEATVCSTNITSPLPPQTSSPLTCANAAVVGSPTSLPSKFNPNPVQPQIQRTLNQCFTLSTLAHHYHTTTTTTHLC